MPAGGAACCGMGLDEDGSVGGAPGPRAYWRTPGETPGLGGGTDERPTENADREEIESIRGSVNRIR